MVYMCSQCRYESDPSALTNGVCGDCIALAAWQGIDNELDTYARSAYATRVVIAWVRIDPYARPSLERLAHSSLADLRSFCSGQLQYATHGLRSRVAAELSKRDYMLINWLAVRDAILEGAR